MIVTPKRNIVQKIINRTVYRLGMKPFPVAFESSLDEAGAEPKTVFNAVYETNYWESEESGSGGGSTIARTELYRPQLVKLLDDLRIESMFDAPCGDLNWMPLVLASAKLHYSGGEIAESALATARRRQPDLDIRHFDLCADAFPDVDLWHCRDTLFHLSNADIWRALDRAAAANIKFAAVTTHKARLLENLDIKNGGFRLLDLERAPFNFPPALRYLKDYGRKEFPRFVGVWPMDAVRDAVRNRAGSAT
jgi:hypothetical protein